MSEEFDDFEELDEPTDDQQVRGKTPGTKINVMFESLIGPSGKKEKMLISLEASVKDLKETVSQLFDLDPSGFHLVHAGRTMDIDDVVSNYDIEDSESILLVPKSTAGIN